MRRHRVIEERVLSSHGPRNLADQTDEPSSWAAITESDPSEWLSISEGFLTRSSYGQPLQEALIQAGPKTTVDSTPCESLDRVAVTRDGLFAGLIENDALVGLRTLPSDLFHVAVTSPPYYWARDYEVDGQIGHEETVEEYVQRLCDVFDEV